MSMFKIPISIANQLEKIHRQFLWGDKCVWWDGIPSLKGENWGGLALEN